MAAGALIVLLLGGCNQTQSARTCSARGLLSCSALSAASLPRTNAPDMSTIDKAMVEMARPVSMDAATAKTEATPAPVAAAAEPMPQTNEADITTGAVGGRLKQKMIADLGHDPMSGKPDKDGRSLAEVVNRAIADHPQIGFSTARIEEARQGITIANAQTRPQLEATFAAGSSISGTSNIIGGQYSGSRDIYANMRADGGFALRQLLFDFGATEADIRKNMKLYDSRRLETYDKVEEVAQKVVNAYIKIIETRALSAAADENVKALERIAGLVRSNQANGNGTIADVQRVQARLVDAITTRSDLNVDMQNAVDQFRRLTKSEPGRLAPLPNMQVNLPKSVDQALGVMGQRHPRLLAINAQNRAMDFELLAQNAQGKPRLTAETDATMKNYGGPAARTELDVRAMLGLRYKISDGGAARGMEDQIRARMSQGLERYRDTRDEIEADIRQFYRAIGSSRSKIQSLREGFDASKKVLELYTEQFQGGKRTLFEVLDAQTSLYNARRSMIVNEHEERRGMYGVLRSVGRLTPAILKIAG